MIPPGDILLDYLQAHNLKGPRGNTWRANVPDRSDKSGDLAVTLTEDRAWGCWYDHKLHEGGTLRQLMERLALSYEWQPYRHAEKTKREFDGLDDYARAHGVDKAYLARNGWSECVYKDRRAIAFKTASGTRWRYIDGGDQKYDSPSGYQRCFYGLQHALQMVKSESGLSLVLCNGESSALAGQYHGVASFCVTGGEHDSLPAELLDQLLGHLKGLSDSQIVIALDSDYAGAKATVGLIEQLENAGIKTYYVDLGLTTGGDLSDFCKLYTKDSNSWLLASANDGKLRGKPTGFVRIEDCVSEADAVIRGNVALPLPLPMPFKNIAKFGGLAELFLPGMMICIAADSGMGKTSVLETMQDFWNLLGVDIVGWSPEWTPMQQVFRRIQRNGGPSVMALIKDNAYQSAIKQGLTDTQARACYYEPLTDEQRALALSISGKVKGYPGMLDIIPGGRISTESLVKSFESAIDFSRGEDHRIAACCVDYAQRLTTEDPKQSDQVNQSLGILKDFTDKNQVTTIVTSQVTKVSGAAALRGENLGNHDLLYARSALFNLVITMSREKGNDGKYSNFATVFVGKNSLGTNGETKIEYDPIRHRWRDCKIARVDVSEVTPAPIPF